MRQVPDQRSTANHPNRIDDGDLRSLIGIEAALFLQVGRVKILRSVGHVIERRHEQGGVNKKRAVLLDENRHLQFRFRLRPISLPRRRFRDARANVNHQKCRQCAGDKQSAPAEMREHDPVNERRKKITSRVALLQNSGEQTSRVRWQRFHCQ